MTKTSSFIKSSIFDAFGSFAHPKIEMTCNLHFFVINEQITKIFESEWNQNSIHGVFFKINICSQQYQIQFVQLITGKKVMKLEKISRLEIH
jgi:hypothetical protein